MVENDKNLCNSIIVPPECKEQFLNLGCQGADLLKTGGIQASGISNLKKGYLISRVTPDFYTVIFTTHGQGRLFAGNKSQKITKGMLFIIPPEFPNKYEIFGNSWDIVWFHLGDTHGWSRLKNNGITMKKFANIEFLVNAMRGFILESMLGEFESERLVRSYSEMILIYLTRELHITGEPGKNSLRARLSLVFSTVNQNLEKKWTATNMAKLMAISPSYFTRLCKEAYNLSPVRLLTRFRMERAAAFLKTTDYPIYIISQQIGYNDEFAFSTAFKRYTGISPSHFRQGSDDQTA